MNLTNYEQTEALKELGYPQDGYPQMMYYPYRQTGMQLSYAFERQHGTQNSACAVPDVHSAIMWLLSSERGRKLWGTAAHVRTYGDGDSCLVLRNGGFIGSREENQVWTPSELLDAMLAAVTEASDAVQ